MEQFWGKTGPGCGPVSGQLNGVEEEVPGHEPGME